MYKIELILEIWSNATYNLDLIVINSLQRRPKRGLAGLFAFHRIIRGRNASQNKSVVLHICTRGVLFFFLFQSAQRSFFGQSSGSGA